MNNNNHMSTVRDEGWRRSENESGRQATMRDEGWRLKNSGTYDIDWESQISVTISPENTGGNVEHNYFVSIDEFKERLRVIESVLFFYGRKAKQTLTNER